ncbi:MAG: DUF5050 domain-containing protein [Lachnospiraceae bacterium]|nr:DUF5050 domain-containing protein [Lachnospiraceae bacterium]
MAHDVFISYSHKDKAIADAVCARLEGDNMRCWYAPRDIVPGADWADSIIKAISSTKVMVLIFTNSSNISQQVLREVSNAVSSGVTVVPFRLTEEEPIAGMKYYLSTVHWLDAMNAELDASISNLSSLCRSLVDNIKAREEGREPVASDEAIRDSITAVRQEKQTAATKKKKTTIAIICVAAAVVIIAAIVLIVVLTGKDKSGQQQANVTPGGDATESVTNDSSSGGSGSGGWGGATSEGVSMDVTETYTQGNSQGNLQSSGCLATDGEWYYYRSNDKQSLYKIRPDGSGETKLTSEPASCISVLDGWIYYYSSSSDPGIRKMKTDGSDAKTIHYGHAEDVRIINNRIYYHDGLDNLYLYSMDLNGKDVVKENSLDKTYSWCSDGTYMYYSNQEDLGYLYRVKLDGSEPTCLVDHKIEGMTIAGNLLYFNDLEENAFCTYDLTTGEEQFLCNDYIYYINVTKDGIYGYSGAQNTYLCYIQLNGLGEQILVEDPVVDVCVCGDKIWYKNKNDFKFYIVDLNGENKIMP